MSELEIAYSHYNRRKVLATVVLFAAAVAVAFGSIFISQLNYPLETTWSVLVAHFNGTTTDSRVLELAVWEYNIPRAIMGVFAGAGLAVGGAVMQSLMRNPLADPYTTGVASGASFGAALAITMGFVVIPTGTYNLDITINAILFSFIPTVAIVLISKKKNITPTTMILAGVAIMYIFRACTSLMTMISDAEDVEQLYIWNVGSLGPARWDNVWYVVIMTTVCTAILMMLSRSIGVMTTGDKSASTMGVNVKIVRAVSLILVASMTATIVGFTGTIGFMGLVAPHIARMIVGSNVKYLIPCSAGVGALFLVVADCIAKPIVEMHVGVITALIGGPIFIVLLIRGAKKVWF